MEVVDLAMVNGWATIGKVVEAIMMTVMMARRVSCSERVTRTQKLTGYVPVEGLETGGGTSVIVVVVCFGQLKEERTWSAWSPAWTM